MDIVRERTCCFTGHRDLAENQIPYLAKLLTDEIERAYHSGKVNFIAGVARGFDALAAQAVLNFKQCHDSVRLILAVPCKNQTRGWPQKDAVIYESIMAQCDKAVCLSEEYDRACMFVRNRWMVDHSAWCISYLTKAKGGTAYTAAYAEQQGLKIVNLADNISNSEKGLAKSGGI